MRRGTTWLRAVLVASALGSSAGAFADEVAPSTSPSRVEFPYSGRLVTHEGFPLAGPVDVELTFWGSVVGRDDITSREPLAFKDVPLLNGVFTVVVSLDSEEADVVFGADGSAWVELKDKTNNRTYKRVKVARPQPVSVTAAAASTSPASTSTSTGGGTATAAPFSPEFVQIAAAACLASQVAGAKFVTGASQDVACTAACGTSRAGSACLRGWTAYEGGASFDFGNECSVAEMAGTPKPLGRLCCCLTGGGPTQVLGEDLKGLLPISH